MIAAGETCRIVQEADLLRVREILREFSKQAGLGIVDQTKAITAGSELARNVLKYAGGEGGRFEAEIISDGVREGVRAIVSDNGPGIPDIDQAMRDGFSTGGSMGIGLPGARRLVDAFEIESEPGRGTTVTITKWVR